MSKEVEQAVGRFVATLIDIASKDARLMGGVHEIATAIATATGSGAEISREPPGRQDLQKATATQKTPADAAAKSEAASQAQPSNAQPSNAKPSQPEPAQPVLRMDQAARKQPAATGSSAKAASDKPKPPKTAAKTKTSKNKPAPHPQEPIVPAQVAVKSLWPAKSPDAPSPKPQLPSSAYQNWLQPQTEDELPDIARRCRLKAEVARWADKRSQRIAAGEDPAREIADRDNELHAEAKQLPACQLWMLEDGAPQPPSPFDFEQIARCYETIGEAAELIYALCEERDRQYFEPGLNLLAEAQSALRVAALKFNGKTDPDQDLLFKWLKFVSSSERIYIARYMRIADPADPEQTPGIVTRIRTLGRRVRNESRQTKLRARRLNKITYVTGKIKAGEDADVRQHWATLLRTIDELVEDGVPPSSREIRELVIDIINEIPENVDKIPANVNQVMREIDSYIAGLPSHETPAATTSTTSPQVDEVAELVRGRKILLIGGEERKPQKQAIEQAFGLSELVWFVTKEHHPVRDFESHVARDDVALVLLAIRWSSHSYGEVNDYCQQYNKPLVRLPGGYNANQIAEQVMTQCADRLRTATN